MYILLTILTWTLLCSGRCDVIPDPGGCKESTWLCDQLSEMRRVMTEQSDVIDHLQTKVSEQDSVIQQLQDQLVTLKRPGAPHTDNHIVSNPSAYDSALAAKSDSSVQPRSDDGGPLEAVVNQMSQQLTTMSADIQAMKNTDQVLQNVNHQQDLNIQDARTSTFVHWGSSQCPADAELVYSGVVGGSWYAQSGGGSNTLCLTMTPVMSSHAVPSSHAFLYGAEYQTYDSAHDNKDAVCAVCRSSHSTTIMIPGTNVCTPGWTKQYDGFLMAETSSHHKSEFICVDSILDSRAGGNADANGRLLYFTITQCGSLPCGPYVTNKVVICVVCSK